MSTRYEGCDAKNVGIVASPAGTEVGYYESERMLLQFVYDEVFYIEGTKAELLEMLDVARERVTRLPDS